MAIFTRFFLLLQLCGLGLLALAQDAPLFIQGGLEDAVVDDEAVYNSGGKITVNGFEIIVPKNLLVQFPAANVPFKDFALQNESMLGYETNVIGNFINGRAIAGQIITYQFFESLNGGFIESINKTDGSMKIAGGPTLRISDPNAVFSVGYADAPFFTADDESPSISSFSGFPMCIPRNDTDPLCPATNRPFQGSGTFAPPDPLVAAPFLVGDWVSFSGIKRGNEMICYSIVADNVQIVTLNDLVYVRMELALLGISNFNPNAELAESRIRGYTSNNRATVALYAMDIDPCTGEVTDRLIAVVGLRNAEQNRFEYRGDILTGYARDYRAVAEVNGVPRPRTTKNGFLTSTYVQPVNVWVHGEQMIPGTRPPANDFSQMPWLTQGVGVDENGNLWGPLDPFPQTGVIIDLPECGPLARIEFKGDDVDTNWESQADLVDETLTISATVTPTLSPVPAATEESRKRSIPRWMSRAKADATTALEPEPAV